MRFESILFWLAVVEQTIYTEARSLSWDGSCSSARVECASKCSGDIATFDCDPSFFGIDSGSYYCTCGVLGSARSCFSGNGIVATPVGKKKMSDIRIGDHILTVNMKGEPEFSPVFSFSSRRPREQSQFVKISTDGNHTVLVTPSHYMFTGAGAGSPHPNIHRWSYVPAGMLKPGDTIPVLFRSSIKPATIREISTERSIGVFLPHTLSGAIIVDGIVATELTTVVPRFLASSRFHHVIVHIVKNLRRTHLGFTSTLVNALSMVYHGSTDATFDGSVI